MKKYTSNIITGFRILCSMMIMFFTVFSCQFYVIYFLCGISDMIDGAVARKTNTASAFGEKFDTIADFVFLTASLIKFLPILNIPKWLWRWVIIIAILKINNILSGFIFKKKLIAPHTVMNKITGLLLFFLPLTIHFIKLKYSFTAVCLIATFSAIQEYLLIRKVK